MRIRIATFALVFSFISILSSGAVSQADNIKDVLNKANKEGKAVMLELGSVGCIPCEQMKPVMEKLKTRCGGDRHLAPRLACALAGWFLVR